MVVLRSGFNTKKTEFLRHNFKRIAKAAQRQNARRKVQENLRHIRNQQEDQRCVICLCFHEPVELALHRKWQRQMKDKPEKKFFIAFPFQLLCCKKFVHLACYVSYQRMYWGNKKDWRCPHCQTFAIYNVKEGNFFLGYQKDYDVDCLHEICWFYLNRNAPSALSLYSLFYLSGKQVSICPLFI